MTNQPLGEPQAGPPRHSRRGEPSFNATSKEPPRTHKASNVGADVFHNIDVIFQKPQPAGFTPGSRAGVAGYTQIMDNERVRGWRVVLEPGQSAAAITQPAPGLRIVSTAASSPNRYRASRSAACSSSRAISSGRTAA